MHLQNLSSNTSFLNVFWTWPVSTDEAEGVGRFNSSTGFQSLAIYFFQMSLKTSEMLFKMALNRLVLL